MQWLDVYESILDEPHQFADHIKSITEPGRRLQLILNLVRAASQHGFEDFQSRTFLFYEAEKFNTHFLPISFESPIPDTKELSGAKSELVKAGRLTLKLNLESELETLHEISPYCHELDFPQHSKAGCFHWQNPAFGPYDSAVYYCMIRHFRPRRVIEIGSGYSTLIALEAAKKTRGTQITCIEPYPRDFLKSNRAITLLERKVQDVELDTFLALEPGDFLFVDSSHISRIGSDVNDIFFRILPSLSPGVLIHFHDIYLPEDYPPAWVKKKKIFYNEQYLLAAFLAFNRDFEILLALHFLAGAAEAAIRSALPSVPEGPVGGGSFWIRRPGEEAISDA